MKIGLNARGAKVGKIALNSYPIFKFFVVFLSYFNFIDFTTLNNSPIWENYLHNFATIDLSSNNSISFFALLRIL